MRGEDKELGMSRPIQRRDFLQGVAVATAGSASLMGVSAMAVPIGQKAANIGDPVSAKTYPPMRTGMRGQHPGSYEGAHAMRDGKVFPTGEDTGETYDLVVVGGGLSGLAAAWYFRQRFGNEAKILVIDNMDDFGGHAKRNEFEYGGKQLIANGGSSYLVAPPQWTHESLDLVRKLGIHKGDPSDRVDGQLYRSMGLEGATLFRKELYGADKLVRGGTPLTFDSAWLAQTPFPSRIKADLDRFVNGKEDYLPGMTPDQKVSALRSMSYRDYMLKAARVHPDVVSLMEGIWCLGADMGSAWFAFFRMRPGFNGIGLERPALSPEGAEHRAEDYTLPAGNSDLARLIVRDLIPDALPPGTFAEIETKRTDYSTLDRSGQKVRVRLNSIVTQVKHLSAHRRLFDPDNSECEVTYLNDGKLSAVKGKNVVMACMNNVVPYILPELPEEQKAALHQAVRAVNQMTNVLFRNWESFAKLKLSNVSFPNTFYGRMGIAQQRYLGEMVPPRDPSEPMVVGFNTGSNSGILSNAAMVSELCGGNPPEPGTYVDDQFRMVRAGLIATPFETFERAVRTQAAAALAGSDFDPARDIVAITVNRWGHGFATGRDTLFEPDRDEKVSPIEIAKQPFGRITIANSDAGGVSTAGTAIDEAFRAVRQLEQRQLGFYERI
ncbi:NAD(P)-binding protein [Hephaestia mangrovi]|uniref:NAD(P)-binding protein n=1 Tax=Hephaestia mangrovi TaxID=2873268 RepID=UPI001CA67FE2|nr:NAD(P)-binding protein [Hephaestia mangrovi]MBY8828919.1 NAD(P)-binding protein [Hephaestia mangrovi]